MVRQPPQRSNFPHLIRSEAMSLAILTEDDRVPDCVEALGVLNRGLAAVAFHLI